MELLFKKSGIYFTVFLILGGGVSCQTQDESVQKKELLYYSLQQEKETSYQLFPKIYSHEISILAHYSGGTTKVYKGFRLWDIDQNGTADSIESLGGDALSIGFDFNNDGILEKGE